MDLIARIRSLFGRREPVKWDAENRLVVSEKYFDVPVDVVGQLRTMRAARNRHDPIEREHNAFLLDPGLGPPTYLSADGRILWDDDGWGVEPALGLAYAAILTGAEKTRIPDLRRLLPPRPADAPTCPECDGTGLLGKGEMTDLDGRPISIGCSACWGMGWQAIPPAMSR